MRDDVDEEVGIAAAADGMAWNDDYDEWLMCGVSRMVSLQHKYV